MRSLHVMQIVMIALCIAQVGKSQPVIANGNNMLPFGYSDSLFQAPVVTSPGPAGQGVTWDFSNPVPAPMSEGYYSNLRPGVTRYNCPNSNYAFQTYPWSYLILTKYYTIDSTGWYLTGGYFSGVDPHTSPYSSYANSQMIMPFPFSFGDQRTDTFQTKTSGSLRITYDGYGIFKSPWATYNDVVRLKYEWSDSSVEYWWFTSSPLFFLAGYSTYQGRSYMDFYITSHPSYVGIKTPASLNDAVSIYPNPTSTASVLHMKGTASQNGTCLLRDVMGRTVKEIQINNGEASIEKGVSAAGIYFYEVYSKGAMIGRGKLVFE